MGSWTSLWPMQALAPAVSTAPSLCACHALRRLGDVSWQANASVCCLWGPRHGNSSMQGGTCCAGMFLEADVGHWEKVNQVNYLGVLYTLKATVPGMVARNAGRILVTNSSGSFLGVAYLHTIPCSLPQHSACCLWS